MAFELTQLITPAIVLVGGYGAYIKFREDVSGRIKGQEDTLVRHEEKFDSHDNRFDHVENRVSTLELHDAETKGFKEGLKLLQMLKKGEFNG